MHARSILSQRRLECSLHLIYLFSSIFICKSKSKSGYQILGFLLEIGLGADGDGDGGFYGLHSGGRETERVDMCCTWM